MPPEGFAELYQGRRKITTREYLARRTVDDLGQLIGVLLEKEQAIGVLHHPLQAVFADRDG